MKRLLRALGVVLLCLPLTSFAPSPDLSFQAPANPYLAELYQA